LQEGLLGSSIVEMPVRMRPVRVSSFAAKIIYDNRESSKPRGDSDEDLLPSAAGLERYNLT